MSSWEKFGLDVADAIDGTMGRRDHVEEVRERLAALSGNAERRRRWPIAVAVAAVAASLLIAIGAIWALGGRVEPLHPITYRVAGVNHHGVNGAWISASSQPAEEAAANLIKVKCPGCTKTFSVEKTPGPQKIHCPYCNTEGMMK